MTAPVVYLVDDDRGLSKALGRLLGTAGYKAVAFATAEDFLTGHDHSVPGCAVIDLALPGMDGLSLQQTLASGGEPLPIVFLTGTGDIPKSVSAMKSGAIDFLVKPVSDLILLEAVKRALALDAETRLANTRRTTIEQKLARLTPREMQVMRGVVAGKLNKQIAYDIGTVEKTVKVHRAHMMKKLGVRTVADLVRLTETVGPGAMSATQNPTAEDELRL
jgi:FixJ family two-component response regulator